MTLITTSERTRLSALAAGALLALAAHAQGLSPQPIDLPAAPLAQSLNALAQKTGVQIVFASPLAAGRTAPAVRGTLTPRQALEQVLAGSGLTVRVADGGQTYVVERAAGASQAAPGGTEGSLAEVRVTADAERGGPTEGTGAYTVRATNAATGLTLSPRETPQTVSVVTRDQIDDQRLETIEEALVRSPGIHLDKSWGSNRPVFYSRGFEVSNITYDGLPISVDGYAFDVIASADLAIYDRVEVVRGSTGLMQGSGNPSAAINLMRKRPTREFSGYAQVHAGSWNNYRAEADVSMPVTADGHIRTRLVGAYQQKDSFVDYMREKKTVAYGTVEADLGPRTVLTLSANLQNGDKSNSWGGLPTYADGSDIGLPRSTNLSTDWARHDTDNTAYVAEVQHRLDGDWLLRGSLMRIKGTMDFAGTWNGGAVDAATGGGLIMGAPGFYVYDDKQTSFNVGASGPIDLLGRRHELNFGASWRTEDYMPWGASAGVDVPIGNVFAWDPTSVAEPDPGVLPEGGWDAKVKESGVYAAGRFQLADSLHLIAGARFLNWKQTSQADLVGYELKNEVVPYGGLVWDLNDQYSLYASYADILKPQQVRDVTGRLIAPVQGKSYEAGLKGEWLDGRLQAAVAAFRVDQDGLAVDDPSTPNPCPPYNLWGHCQIGKGLVRSEGVELSVSGEVARGLELSAGYTYNRSHTEDRSTQDWKQASTNLPRHTLRMSASYRLSEAWKFGASLNTQSRIYNEGVSSGVAYRIEQKRYTLLDLMARWTFLPGMWLQANLNNVLDQRYYQSISSPSSGNHYGEPRNLLVTLHRQF